MKKKLLAIALILALVFSMTACNKNKGSKEETEESEGAEALTPIQEEFAAFVDEQYKTSIEDSYLTMHIYYIDPEASGIDRDSVAVEFGTASDDASMEEDRTYYNSLLTALKGFNRDDLTRLQQDEYDSLEWEINSVLALCDKKFDYYEQLFAVPNSVDSNIVSYLSIWQIRDLRDAQDTVKLIDSLPAYVDSCIAYAKEQQKRELFMTKFDDVIKGCDDVINAGMDSFVVERILEEVDNLKDASAQEKEECKKEISEAFKRSYLPAFETIKAAMNEMKDGYNNPGSLFDFPEGKEYYQALLNYTLGSYDVPATDFMEFSAERSDLHMEELANLYSKSAAEIGDFYSNPPTTGYSDYDSILKAMEGFMLKDFPEVKNLDYLIQAADEEEKLDEKNVAAYFVIPPVDGDNKQQMRVNPSNEDAGSMDSYTTVTHEGFPGHMYQYAFIADNIDSDYIKTLGIDGTVEGYAVYAQYLSLKYLDSIKPASKAIARLNDQISYLDYGYADMKIHFEGWGPEELHKYFVDSGYGITLDVAKDLYEFLRFTPTYYVPYGVGYEYIESLREKAEEAAGKKFNLLEFNRALLMAGPTPRSVLSRYVDEYIEGTK